MSGSPTFDTEKNPETGAFYDSVSPTAGGVIIQCDSSVGAALMQNDQPVAYASRALADAETSYAPIEKEMLAVVYSLERFHQYTYGRHTVVYSDHKPLEMILKKPLIKAAKRLQNMILRVQKYNFTLFYKPGKTMHLADTLSRAHNTDDKDPIMDQADVNVVTYLPMSEERLTLFTIIEDNYCKWVASRVF